MNFVRVKKRGQDQRTTKTWMPEGHTKNNHTYKITWAKEVFGVAVKPHYHATVQCLRNIDQEFRQWDFAGRRGPYKTFEAAVEACERHEKAWLAAIEVSEGERNGRNDKLRTIEYRARLKSIRDKKPVFQKTMTGIPVWVRNKANTVLMNFFFPRGKKRIEEDDECENGPTSTSPTSAPDSVGPTASNEASNIPASPVKAEEKSSIRHRSASTKPEPSTTAAPLAEAADEAAVKPASKRTRKPSASGKAKSAKTVSKKPPEEVGSRSSRRKSA